MAHLIAVYLKLPEPGRVKTRLAAEIGDAAAAEVYVRLAEETLRHLPWSMVRVLICFDPPERESDIKHWLHPLIPPGATVEYLPQCEGDLGQRLRAVVDDVFARAGTETLTLIGTDCPALRWPAFVITQRMARENIDAVFGPSLDGGYYLLALRQPCPELFSGIPWSTGRTLEASLAAAELAGRKVHLLERRLRDIDCFDDLRAWSETAQNSRHKWHYPEDLANRRQ